MPVYKKLTLVMQRVGYLKKDGKVAGFGMNYEYLSEERITGEVHAAFAEVGLVMLPVATEILSERDDTNDKGKVSHLVRIRTRYRLVDAEDESFVEIEMMGEGADAGDKALNKANTGCYKYAQRQALLISTGDDPDQEASAPASATKTITPARRRAAAPEPPSAPEMSPAVAWLHKRAAEAGYASLEAFVTEQGLTMDALLADTSLQRATNSHLKRIITEKGAA